MRTSRTSLLARCVALGLAIVVTAPVSAPSKSAERRDPAHFSVDVASRDVVLVGSWRLKYGDDPAWALSQTPDSGWLIVDKPGAFWALNGLPDKGIGWYRARIHLVSRADSLNPLSMRIIHYPTAQEIYWDGVLIATNGRLGRSAGEERWGLIAQSMRIPHELTGPGEHLLAFRVSNHLNATGGLGEVKLGAWKPLQNSFHGQWALLLFFVGIICVTGLYFFANLIARVNRTYALFSLICLGCVLQTIPRYFAFYLNLDFEANRWFHAVQYLGYSIILCSLPLCFFSEFSSLSRKWYWMVVATTAVVVLPCELYIFDLFPSSMLPFVKVSNDIIGFAAIAVCLGVAGWAVYRKKENSLLASLGLVCMLAGVALGVIYGLQFTWPLGLTALILFLNVGLTRTFVSRSLAYQEVHLKGARLEIELLKKNIQPHFLLTSLRSITEWLEKEPRTAARLVNALATELRIMLKMTTERTVSLGEEVNLCRTHLEVMGLRRHRALILETNGVDGEERMPPMVLHTLLGMGLEEAEEGDEDIHFLLERIHGNGLRLCLSHMAPLKSSWRRGEDETGLQYVRARLQECFPNRWTLRVGNPNPSFASSAAAATWTAEVRITDSAALARVGSLFAGQKRQFAEPEPAE